MQTQASVITGFLFQNVDELVSAANGTNVPLWIATAFVEKESRGQNIYGNDSLGTFAGKGIVTQANYAKFYDAVIVNHGRSNGVGPMQITWPGFLVDAQKRNIHLWNPLENYVYGLKLIAGFLQGNYSTDSITKAGALYNGALTYGISVADRAQFWHSHLVDSVAPSKTVLQVNSPQHVSITKLQIGLNQVFPAYSHLTIDGNFGPATENVITQFQSRLGLLPDGVIGPATTAALNSVGITF